MSQWSYRAADAKGRLLAGRMDAQNLVDLELRLKRMQLDLINADPVRGTRFASGAVPRRELITFCFHLEQLQRAGVPILEGLADLRDSIDNPRLREVIAACIEAIEGGRTLSQALEEHPRVFDGIFVSLIRAGEDTGNLAGVLTSLVDTLKWQDELAAHTRKLIMYPAFLATVVLAVTLFMMLYLVPKMAAFIRNMDQQLPLHTRILIETSQLFVDYWYLLLGLPLLGIVLLSALISHDERAAHAFDALKLRLPGVGGILHKIILSRFCATFAMMYASGITILDAIRACESVVGNRVLRDGLRHAAQLIGEGQNVSTAFQNIGLFPPLVLRMLRVGERTGDLDAALGNVSYFYNRDVRESVARVQAMIEPLMTVVVGVILGWVGLAVLGPIYDAITNMKF